MVFPGHRPVPGLRENVSAVGWRAPVVWAFQPAGSGDGICVWKEPEKNGGSFFAISCAGVVLHEYGEIFMRGEREICKRQAGAGRTGARTHGRGVCACAD